jgi:hypothetical protein
VTRAAGDPEIGGDAVAARPAGRVISVLAGLRHPVVLILLAIAFFSAISGKPLDGALMLVVALCLAWDTGRQRGANGRTGRGATVAAAGVPAAAVRGRRRVLVIAGLVAGGAVFAAVTGLFSRYSWPATAAVMGLGAVAVVIGWRGPVRQRQARDRLPVAGTAAWGGLLVLGCLWELVALLRQPSLTTTSYAHPTISALTDPVLAGAGGRTAVLAAWLALGWYLIRR